MKRKRKVLMFLPPKFDYLDLNTKSCLHYTPLINHESLKISKSSFVDLIFVMLTRSVSDFQRKVYFSTNLDGKAFQMLIDQNHS